MRVKSQCMRALQLGAGVMKTRKDPSELERKIRDTLNMDVKKVVVDRVYPALNKFESYVREDQLHEVIRPAGVGDQSLEGAFRLLRGVFTYSFRETVMENMTWKRKDDDIPNDVRQTILEVAPAFETEYANGTLGEKMDRRRRPQSGDCMCKLGICTG